MPLAGFLSTVAMLAALRIEHGDVPRTSEALRPLLEQFAASKLGIFLMIAPGQSVFLVVALAAALASPVGWRERLRLTWGRFPTWRWSWPALALGTPMVGFISSIIVAQLIDAKSENLVMLQKVFRDQHGPFVLVLYLIVGILPGVAEELLFRGYVQSRLLLRLPAWAAIGITAAMFAVAHFDPVHVVSVFPLGVWLGILAWRTGSIWPAVLAHAVNNSVAILMTRWGEIDMNSPADLMQRGMMFMICGYMLLIAIMLLLAMRAPKAAVVHV
jgi:membrane protease YdiL (CAAX protease family)